MHLNIQEISFFSSTGPNYSLTVPRQLVLVLLKGDNNTITCKYVTSKGFIN